VQPFFNDITIYGLSQKTFAQYTMINPLITDWTHDTYDYAAGSQVIQHTMSIRYEAVKYYSGNIGGNTPSGQVNGFADPAHYDTEKSPIAVPGSTYSPAPFKQDLQALAQGQNTLQNLIGAVGQALVPTASAFLGGQLAGSGAYTQQIVGGLAPAIAASIPQAAVAGPYFPVGDQISAGISPVSPQTPAGYNPYDDAGY
jgi:hypothetical protein